MNNKNTVPHIAKPPGIRPVKVERREQEGLLVTWKMGDQPELLACELLRRSCPCAACREERGDGSSHEKPLTPKKATLRVVSHTKEEQTQIAEIWAVGNYALGIRWADGHDDGIYTFEYLYDLTKNS